jgi:pyruvate/2-oxoglutarate/acetoin dehydrogenase E1 component
MGSKEENKQALCALKGHDIAIKTTGNSVKKFCKVCDHVELDIEVEVVLDGLRPKD